MPTRARVPSTDTRSWSVLYRRSSGTSIDRETNSSALGSFAAGPLGPRLAAPQGTCGAGARLWLLTVSTQDLADALHVLVREAPRIAGPPPLPPPLRSPPPPPPHPHPPPL